MKAPSRLILVALSLASTLQCAWSIRTTRHAMSKTSSSALLLRATPVVTDSSKTSSSWVRGDRSEALLNMDGTKCMNLDDGKLVQPKFAANDSKTNIDRWNQVFDTGMMVRNDTVNKAARTIHDIGERARWVGGWWVGASHRRLVLLGREAGEMNRGLLPVTRHNRQQPPTLLLRSSVCLPTCLTMCTPPLWPPPSSSQPLSPRRTTAKTASVTLATALSK